MMDLRSLARALGGEVVGGQVLRQNRGTAARTAASASACLLLLRTHSLHSPMPATTGAPAATT